MDYFNKENRILLSREIAREGLVLLKNDSSLPIKNEKISLFGITQVETIKGGTGSAFVNVSHVVSILEGLENSNVEINKDLSNRYKQYSKQNHLQSYGVWGTGSHINPEMPIDENDIREASLVSSKAIFVIGRTAGENDDTLNIEGDYLLSSVEKEMLDNINKYFSDIVVIINSGNLIDLSYISSRTNVRAILLAYYPGMEGGNAIADILTGKYSPSGKLTDTIACSFDDYPSSDFFGKKAGIIQNYYEDIYVGYRYFYTIDKKKNSVLYPFGFGLSYASFKQTLNSFKVKGTKASKIACICIEVKNTSKRYSGKDVVMIYSSSPNGKLDTPKYELRDFKKTKELKPGEIELVTFEIELNSIASFDEYGKLGKKGAWALEKGRYSFYFGNRIDKVKKAGIYELLDDKIFKKQTLIKSQLSKRLMSNGKYQLLDTPKDKKSDGVKIDFLTKNIISKDNFYKSTSEYTEYRLNISSAGLYSFSFSSNEKACRILINGNELEEIDRFYRKDDIILPFGINQIVFEGNKNQSLTSMEIEKNNDPIRISSSEKTVFEAGKYSESALYVINRSFKDNDDNAMIKYGKGLFRLHTPGRYASYKLEFEKPGKYDLRFRYSTYHETRSIPETFAFYISNVIKNVENVSLEKTANEGEVVFKTTNPIQIDFPSGEVYLKIVSCATETPFIAAIELTPSTRTVVKTIKNNGNIETEELPNEGFIERKPLAPLSSKYDLRNVANGLISLDDFIDDLNKEELVSLTCGNTNGHIAYIPNRGIPELTWSDGPVGFRQDFNVIAYPSSTMIATSWNLDLARAFGEAIGAESIEYNVDFWLAPGLNIHRNPCCGRNFEYYSEDPFVSGKCASAVVLGVEKYGTSTTIKHFAANNTEYQRIKSNSVISNRALREIYMKGFEIAIKDSNPDSIMTSYNFINGKKVCENNLICNGIIKKDFVYNGILMTDFGNDSKHELELSAGHDLKMPSGDINAVISCIDSGELDINKVKSSAKKILEVVLDKSIKKGLF